MEPWGSMTCSQKPPPPPIMIQSALSPLSLISTLILYANPRRVFHVIAYHRGSCQPLCIFFIHATCPAPLILLDLITGMMFGDAYNVGMYKSELYFYHHHHHKKLCYCCIFIYKGLVVGLKLGMWPWGRNAFRRLRRYLDMWKLK
jgi:hypothetical protein